MTRSCQQPDTSAIVQARGCSCSIERDQVVGATSQARATGTQDRQRRQVHCERLEAISRTWLAPRHRQEDRPTASAGPRRALRCGKKKAQNVTMNVTRRSFLSPSLLIRPCDSHVCYEGHRQASIIAVCWRPPALCVTSHPNPRPWAPPIRSPRLLASALSGSAPTPRGRLGSRAPSRNSAEHPNGCPLSARRLRAR